MPTAMGGAHVFIHSITMYCNLIDRSRLIALDPPRGSVRQSPLSRLFLEKLLTGAVSPEIRTG
jgi:hypothetical protein